MSHRVAQDRHLLVMAGLSQSFAASRTAACSGSRPGALHGRGGRPRSSNAQARAAFLGEGRSGAAMRGVAGLGWQTTSSRAALLYGQVTACWIRRRPQPSPRARGHRPRDGAVPKSPQQAAGVRIEPPPSLAWAAGTMPPPRPRPPRPRSRRKLRDRSQVQQTPTARTRSSAFEANSKCWSCQEDPGAHREAVVMALSAWRRRRRTGASPRWWACPQARRGPSAGRGRR